jgi:Domain of unknown function (DUF1906)
MKRLRVLGILFPLICVAALFLTPKDVATKTNTSTTSAKPVLAYKGFDLNEYPGDDALAPLKKTFSFTNFWLSPPPGEKRTTWLGKRRLLESRGFGFAVLYLGPDSRKLKDVAAAEQKGALAGENAAKLGHQEGFAPGTVIFLDIEEGGRLPAAYHAYLKRWTEVLQHAGFRAGAYCSAMPVAEGQGAFITTAQDIENHLGPNRVELWVYNDACPPSPGCVFPATAPDVKQGGFASAKIWQYAQSPRRKEFTAQCAATYNADGNCYAPEDEKHKWFLDANTATSGNPSGPEEKNAP